MFEDSRTYNHVQERKRINTSSDRTLYLSVLSNVTVMLVHYLTTFQKYKQ